MEEETLEMTTIYAGRIVSLERHEVLLPDGRHATREVVRHGPAVAVVAEMADGRFAFVQQFRKPLERVMLELVAGLCNPGEPLEHAAAREAREETGYEVTQICRLGALYPSPGYVDERIEIYYARLAESPEGTAFDPDEWVELCVLSYREVQDAIAREEILDGKTLAGWAMYERLIKGRGNR